MSTTLSGDVRSDQAEMIAPTPSTEKQPDDEEVDSADEDVQSAPADDDDDDDDGEEDLETNDERLEKEEAEALKADLGEDLREGKRIRRAAKETNGEQSEGPSSSSSEVWKGIQSEEAPSASAADVEEKLVRVVRTYRFAGEEVKEEKMLPASSKEAKAYLASQKDADVAAAAATAASSSKSVVQDTQPPRPPPGPRKRKAGALAAMSAAATAKPTKLNTLEKSKMDWSNFKDTTLDEQAKHELDAQTRVGGSGLGSMKGYMERRNFLERVQGRLDGQSEKK